MLNRRCPTPRKCIPVHLWVYTNDCALLMKTVAAYGNIYWILFTKTEQGSASKVQLLSNSLVRSFIQHARVWLLCSLLALKLPSKLNYFSQNLNICDPEIYRMSKC